eukprot:XP_794992.3 PREDICTED: GRIP and coiled-coil domain-containing protein 2 [Strongylocentrotus purpuratus]
MTQLRETVAELNAKKGQLEEESLQRSASHSEDTQQEIVSLKKSVRESEEKVQKMKAVALKAKKELDLNKKQMVAISQQKEQTQSELQTMSKRYESLEARLSGSHQHVENYQSLHNEYEKLQDELEAKTERIKELEKQISETQQDLNNLSMECTQTKQLKEELVQRLDGQDKEIKTLERGVAEMRSRATVAEEERDAERTEKTEKEQQLQQANERVVILEKSLNEQKTTHDNTTRKLGAALQEASQSNLMDLEIADYEKTVSSLNATIDERDTKITTLTTEVDNLEKRLDAMQNEVAAVGNQRDQAEERANKIKGMLMKAKKELSDLKKTESEQRSAEAALYGQVEYLTQQAEDGKMEQAKMAADNQKLKDQMRTSNEANMRAVRSLEQKATLLQEDLDLANRELTGCQAEFESYKVRVHSVLKQQKTRETNPVAMAMDAREREESEQMMQALRSKLNETGDKMVALRAEHELLQGEHDRLSARHSEVIQDMEAKEALARERLEKLRIESHSRNIEHTESIKELTAQNEALTSSFKIQMRQLQDDHHRTMDSLQRQLESTENQLYRAQQEIQRNNSMVVIPTRTPVESSKESPLESAIRTVPGEREQAEGMEHTDTEIPKSKLRPTLPPISTQSPTQAPPSVPFAQLLSSPTDDRQSIFSAVSSTAEEEQLKSQLTAAQHRIDHFTEITGENEAAILRLTEQAKVLKEEIRRLERNQARENAISNMEYLKNVVLKFVSLPQGDEKGRLLPVLKTMLKLSDTEIKHLATIAQGDDATQKSGSPAGSYLHRWSGGLL